MAKPVSTLRAWLLSSIRFYRQLGFFRRQARLSDEAIADVLSSYQREAPEPFEPGKPYSDLLLLRYDTDRVIYENLSRRVRRGQHRYRSVLEGLAQISRGAFDPRQITEEWMSDSGPVILRFQLGQGYHEIVAKTPSERFDMMVLMQLNLLLERSPYRFEVVDPDNGAVFIVVLSGEERSLIESDRRLPFHVLDLARALEPLAGLGEGWSPEHGVLKLVGTLNEYADRSLGQLELQVEGSTVTGAFRYYGEDHSERFEFVGGVDYDEGVLGGQFRGTIRVAGEERYHPYIGDWVGQFCPGLQVATGTWRGWLQDDGVERAPEDAELIYMGQWGVVDESLLEGNHPFLRRFKRWLSQVWSARHASDYPVTISPGLRI